MRKLYWIASIASIAVLLFFCIFPWFAGFWLQSHYSAIIKPFNQSAYIKAEVVRFDRGWFRSQAQVRLSFDDDPSGRAYIIDQKIEHGPMMVVRSEDGSRDIVLARAVIQSQDNEDHLSFNADTLWTLANHINTDLQVRHAHVGNAHQQIELNHLLGFIRLMPNHHDIEAGFSLGDGALFVSNPEKVRPDLIELMKVGSVDHLNIRLEKGVRHFSARKMSFSPYADKTIELDRWHMDVAQSQKNGWTDFQLNNEVDRMTGGLIDMNQLDIKIALKNMKTSLLENAAVLFAQTSNFQRIQLYALINQLLDNGMQANIDAFNFITPEGPVTFQANLSSTEDIDHQVAQLKASAQAPHDWLLKELTAYYAYKKSENPHLKIEPTVMAQQHMKDWLRHHFFVLKEDGQIVATLQYADGQLSLNGEMIVAK